MISIVNSPKLQKLRGQLTGAGHPHQDGPQWGLDDGPTNAYSSHLKNHAWHWGQSNEEDR